MQLCELDGPCKGCIPPFKPQGVWIVTLHLHREDGEGEEGGEIMKEQKDPGKAKQDTSWQRVWITLHLQSANFKRKNNLLGAILKGAGGKQG